MLGQCCDGYFTFISSLLERLFLNNGDVPGFQNIDMGEEVLIGKSEGGYEILRWEKSLFFRPAE